MTTHLEDHVIPPSKQREKPRSGLKWIGKDMKRVEDPRLLTGKGRYIDDVALPNMAHAAVLRSPHAHARVVSIDTSKAEAWGTPNPTNSLGRRHDDCGRQQQLGIPDMAK